MGIIRPTYVTGVKEIRDNVFLVNLQCSAYQTIVQAKEILVGRKVLYVPLDSLLYCGDARDWQIDWHCALTTTPNDKVMMRVVPRNIDGYWSQGALVLQHPMIVTEEDREREREKEREERQKEKEKRKERDKDRVWDEDDWGWGDDYTVYAQKEKNKRDRVLFAPLFLSLHSAFVDLMQNRTLLRTMVQVRVIVQLIPKNCTFVEWEEDGFVYYGLSPCPASASSSASAQQPKRMAYDCRLKSTNIYLSAKQLLRQAKQFPSSVSLLPVISNSNHTIPSFLESYQQTTQQQQQQQPQRKRGRETERQGSSERWQHKNDRGSEKGSVERQREKDERDKVNGVKRKNITATSPWNNNHKNPRRRYQPCFYDVDDAEVDQLAQEFLALVDQIVPSDAIGVIVRPFDLEENAFVEQRCPYMQLKCAAFVPALSRF